MFYLFPFQNKIAMEVRKYRKEKLSDKMFDLLPWNIRNFLWVTITPLFGHYIWKLFRPKTASKIIDLYNSIVIFMLSKAWFLSSDRTKPTEQQIRYPVISNNSRYTFTFWAFPLNNYLNCMGEFFEFCQEYFEKKDYRCNMLNVGYIVAKDNNNFFSYSYEEDMATLDPVCTGQEGWNDFLINFNKWCVERNGKPLFNQTDNLNYDIIQNCFGEDRLNEFRSFVKKFDPNNRLLNDYFFKVMGFRNEM